MIRRERTEGIEQKKAKSQFSIGLEPGSDRVDVCPGSVTQNLLPDDDGRKLRQD